MHDQVELAISLGADVDILEPGRYWADVFPNNRIAWESFLKVNAGAVFVEHTEEDETEAFVIFTTNKALVYPLDLGLPPANAAPASIREKRDTVSRPDLPKDPTDDLPDVGGTLTKLGIFAGICLAIFAGLSLARR